MQLFKKKPLEPGQEPVAAPEEEKKEEAPADDGAPSLGKISTDVIKMKAQIDQFVELRKIINERFTRINEQSGELRGMIMDSNRAMQEIEVKTLKAVDLVEAVHPDKLMVDVRKQDAKIESLKANIESNDSILKSVMDQVKDMRHQMSTFRGLEQVINLSNEVKTELMNIKKVEATVERHSDKIEGIFVESQKRFQEFESIGDKIKEVQKQTGTATQAVEQLKVKVPTFAAKKEMEDLITRVNNFEKHVSNVIDLLTKRSQESVKEIEERFKKLEESMNAAFNNNMKRAETMNALIEKIEKDAPRIAKELQITEQLKNVEVKKIESESSEETKEGEEAVEAERKGFFQQILAKFTGGAKKEGEGGGGEEKK